MKNCSIEGCINKYYAKGYCSIHYNRVKRGVSKNPLNGKGHHNRGIEKLWENTNKNGPIIEYVGTNCWVYGLSKTHNGYGRVFINGKQERAHCLSWKIHNNKEIQKGMQICHKCDNTSCVNPEHLFLGTPKDNAQDRKNKGRSYTGYHKGEKSGRSKLKEVDIIKIREDSRSNRKIALDYNINYSSVSDIKRRKTWKHI